MIVKGKIARVLLPRGYGFILGDDGKSYFVHASNCPVWDGQLQEGMRVEFVPEQTSRGPRATQVKVC
jgi:cold shock CspA family protein